MKRFLTGFRLQLLGLIILPLSVVLLILSLSGVEIHQEAMRRLVAERDERSVRAAAASISQQLHHSEAAIQALSLRVAESEEAKRVLDQSAFLYNDFDLGLAVVSLDGKILASVGEAEAWLGTLLEFAPGDTSDEEAQFEELKIEGDTLVVVSSRRGEWITAGAISASRLMRSATLGTRASPESYRALLIDQSGAILAGVGTEGTIAIGSNHPGVQAVLRGETGSTYLPAEDGEHVVAFATVSPTGWGLIIEEPWEAVASPVLDVSLAAPLALVPALAATLIALWFGSRQIITPLRELETKAQDLTEGSYESIEEPVGGIAEIQNLQDTLTLMTRRVRNAQEALRGYISSITSTQEDERRRLARELHDQTIQDLIALGQQAQIIGMKLKQDDHADLRDLQQLQEAIQETIDGVRRISRGLRPIYLEDLGLVAALEMLAHDVQAEQDLTVEFSKVGEVRRLHSEVELALYRMAQEALSNVSRHAAAQKAWLTLEYQQDGVKLTIRDNGVGFQTPDQTSELALSGHYGLIGMQERAVLIDAQLEVHSAPGEGTQIAIVCPYTP